MVFNEEVEPASCEEIIYAAFMGGLMGEFFEGLDMSAGAIHKSSVSRNTGALLRLSGDETVENVIKMGLGSEENTEAHKLALELQGKLTNGKIKDAELGRLYALTMQSRTKRNDASTGKAGNTVVQRIRQAIPQMQNAAPVAEVTGNELPKGERITGRLLQFVNAIGNKVNRPWFGDVLFSRGRIKNSMVGHGTGPAKIETFAAVPAVIRNGVQIDHQENWKGRGYDTYTFAAPVTYRGRTIYLGVVVTKDTQDGRYYLHEVVNENGDVIFQKK